MADSTQDYISTLNDLIQTCKDGQQGFKDAAEGVTDSDLRSFFSDVARQRAQFASDLQMQVANIGGEPENSGTVGGSMHRGWMNLKAAITGKDNHAILAECERGEDSAVKAYADALEEHLPQDLRSVVERQYNAILDTHNRVKSMRDGTSAAMKTETVRTAGRRY